jgi:hypothetical protein
MRAPYALTLAVALLLVPPETANHALKKILSPVLIGEAAASDEHVNANAWSRSQATASMRSSNENPALLKIDDVLVGAAVLQDIPRHETYRYALVNGQRLVVDAASLRVIYVLE